MNNILKLYPQYTQTTDRRQLNQSVDSERRLEDDRRHLERLADPKLNPDITKIQNTYKAFINNTDTFQSSVNNLDKTVNKNKSINKAVFAAMSPIIPVRRISSVPDKIKDKDYAAITGTVAVAGILLPEDLRDMKDAGKQILLGKMPKYNYKEFQAHFSFIRGSFLEPIVNKMNNKYGYYLHEWDKSLLDTRIGKKIRKILNVKYADKEFTGRIVPQIRKDEITEEYVKQNAEVIARQLKGSKIGKLICRGLQRTTVYGVLTLSAICVPSIIRAFNKPENIEDKFANAGKQTIKSAISTITTLTGIGLGGALLVSLGLGPAGSVIGMGLGCVIGAYASNKINKNIKTK